jgi:triosephosphate isomerase (TIM)
MNRRKLIAGNWKMHGSLSAMAEIDAIAAGCPPSVDVAIFPPFTLIASACGRGVRIGGQDCHGAAQGAHTGCISATMLAEAGASYCIVGHSERRADQGETDEDVRLKANSAMAAGLAVIMCVGETLAQRQAGAAEAVVRRQLLASQPESGQGFVIAYEPIWAIGTGHVPSAEEIAAMHAAIRTLVGSATPILYGGSVNRANAAEILHIPNVDGALVGGASLCAEDFVPIIMAAVDKGRPSD